MIEPYFISSLAVMALSVAAMRFFWPLVSGMQGTFEGYMVRSIIWMGGTMFARTFYWDMMQGFLPREAWLAFSDTFGAQNASVVFNLGFIVALYYALQGARYLLPEADRTAWPWWKVWTYPQGPCLARWKNRKGRK